MCQIWVSFLIRLAERKKNPKKSSVLQLSILDTIILNGTAFPPIMESI